MNKILKKNIVKIALFLLHKVPSLRCSILNRSSSNKFTKTIQLKVIAVEKEEKKIFFKQLKSLYQARKYVQFMHAFEKKTLWLKETENSKYFRWAALICKGDESSKFYLGEAVKIDPIEVNNIATSIVISGYPNKLEIEQYIKQCALLSNQMTPLAFCYFLAKFGQFDYLNKLINKHYFMALLNDKEQLEVYYLTANYKYVPVIYETNQPEIFTPKCFERVYDSYTRIGDYLSAEAIFKQADKLYAPLPLVVSQKINPHVINNKLERHFWFSLGHAIRGYHTYKRQVLSQVLHVTFKSQYTQLLKDIVNNDKVLVVASWGPGDEIRFSGVYNLLTQLNPNITFTCEPRLFNLFSELYPKSSFIAVQRAQRVDLSNAKYFQSLPHPSLHHLMDTALCKTLCNYNKITILTDIIGELLDQYVISDYKSNVELSFGLISFNLKNDIDCLKAKNKTLVGVSWRSSLAATFRDEHYFSIAELSPLFELENIIFINLQYDDCSHEINNIPLGKNSEFITLDIDQYNDFSSVLFTMQQLDIVVSAATTVLELAGLSGIKTYALSNHYALSARTMPNHRDLWFNNIHYIDNMTTLSKVEIITRIAEEIQTV